jgi:hypothetical protein
MIVPLDQHDVGTPPRAAAIAAAAPAGRAPLAQPPGTEHLGLEEQPAMVGGICRHRNSRFLTTVK